jgi:hypothetical protein
MGALLAWVRVQLAMRHPAPALLVEVRVATLHLVVAVPVVMPRLLLVLVSVPAPLPAPLLVVWTQTQRLELAVGAAPLVEMLVREVMPTPRLLRAQAALPTLARAVTKKMAMTQILLLETVALLVAELVRCSRQCQGGCRQWCTAPTPAQKLGAGWC